MAGHRRGPARCAWPRPWNSAAPGALSTHLHHHRCSWRRAVVYFVVFVERAQRRLVVQYPKRQVGQRMFGGESSHLPLRLNTSGVIPPIFASSLLLMPRHDRLVLGGVGRGLGRGAERDPVADLDLPRAWLSRCTWLLYVGLIAFFCVLLHRRRLQSGRDGGQSEEAMAASFPGSVPGKNTADYLEYVLSRLTVLGAAYLSVVCMLPELLISKFAACPSTSAAPAC
jgi:preprotein translocase subunit SecY